MKKSVLKLIMGLRRIIMNVLEQIEKELPSTPEVQHLINFIRTSKIGIVR